MYAYTLTIESPDEFGALAWASARWEGARVLYDVMHSPDNWDGETFPAVFGLAEHEAWEVKEAIQAEDSGFIPCLSGELTNRIQALLESIV